MNEKKLLLYADKNQFAVLWWKPPTEYIESDIPINRVGPQPGRLQPQKKGK